MAHVSTDVVLNVLKRNTQSNTLVYITQTAMKQQHENPVCIYAKQVAATVHHRKLAQNTSVSHTHPHITPQPPAPCSPCSHPCMTLAAPALAAATATANAAIDAIAAIANKSRATQDRCRETRQCHNACFVHMLFTNMSACGREAAAVHTHKYAASQRTTVP
jgi:hypothetical protein